jgi:hypothetical protein
LGITQWYGFHALNEIDRTTKRLQRTCHSTWKYYNGLYFERANPPRGGDAKSWVAPGRDRQKAEGDALRRFLLFRNRYIMKGDYPSDHKFDSMVWQTPGLPKRNIIVTKKVKFSGEK